MEKKITVKQIYMLFLQNCLMVFEGPLRSLQKDKLTILESSDVLYRFLQKLIWQKMTWCLEVRQLQNYKNYHQKRTAKINRIFSISLLKTVTYLEYNFNFTRSNYLHAVLHMMNHQNSTPSNPAQAHIMLLSPHVLLVRVSPGPSPATAVEQRNMLCSQQGEGEWIFAEH